MEAIYKGDEIVWLNASGDNGPHCFLLLLVFNCVMLDVTGAALPGT